jgi:hypothetical protein
MVPQQAISMVENKPNSLLQTLTYLFTEQSNHIGPSGQCLVLIFLTRTK